LTTPGAKVDAAYLKEFLSKRIEGKASKTSTESEKLLLQIIVAMLDSVESVSYWGRSVILLVPVI
jgi:hypothetical protein